MTDLQPQAPPQRICVIRLSAIGDTCHALAVIRRIQDNWPQTSITWIIGKTEASLMADIAGIEFIIFDKSRGRHAYKDVAADLRGHEFDIVLCMHASMRANLLCRRVQSKVRLGFDRARARDFQWLFTNQRIPAAGGEHALLAMMSFATTMHAEPRPIRWEIPLTGDTQQFASSYRNSNGRLVVISPCSSQRNRNFRNWRVENYAAIIEHLLGLRCRVVLTGGNSEVERAYGEALCDDGTAENLIGQTSLKQLLALIDAADLVICPDSGPAHMASAVSTPVLGLYATSNPNRTGPFASRELTVNRYPDAVEKYLGKDVGAVRWGQRVRHEDAMDLITIDDVKAKIDGFFSI